MPRALSLKKSQQAASAKSQKSITHFFKNTTEITTQAAQKSPHKSPNSTDKSTELKTGKRKALSPVQVDIIEIIDDPIVKNGIAHSPSNEISLNTPKKCKLEKNNKIPLNKSPKQSFQKENSTFSQPSSPRKMPESPRNQETYDHDVLCKKQAKLPLSPVKLNNLNHDKTIVCYNGKEIAETNNDHSDIENAKHETDKCNIKKNDCNNTPRKSVRRSTTPQKSPVKGFDLSPVLQKLRTPVKVQQEKWTPEKVYGKDLSPSKSGSTMKKLSFDELEENVFDDEWDLGGMEEDIKEDLDLGVMQRCEVLSVTQNPGTMEVRLKNQAGQTGTCLVEGLWLSNPLSPGEIVSIVASKNSSGQYFVGNQAGLLALRPDHLMSSTSVVAGVFCKRKAVLQERWRGIDSANVAMTIGILIHELVQKAITRNITDVKLLRIETERIIKESIQMLYDAGIGEEEAKSNMEIYLQPLADFMRTYMGPNTNSVKPKKGQWDGHIDKVLDIEENICCPQLGLKGKIDATLQVTIRGRDKSIVPLELKSGKASVSAEHRGQLILYGMMLSVLRAEDPTTSLQRGLLLYLKDRVDVREVSCGYPERRDLVMLRNQLVEYLATGVNDVDPEQVTDIEDASCLLQQRLPEPVQHHSACAKCPYLTVCSLHLWHTDGPSVSDSHPLTNLREQALGHLTPDHVKYFLHWTALLRMEERSQMTSSPLHALWTDGVEKRAKRGTCAAHLKLKTAAPSGDRFLHVFERKKNEIVSLSSSNKGPQEGEFSIVSIEKRPWIAAGVVTVVRDTEMSILLERNLSSRLPKETVYHIDTYESYATTIQNLTNLGVLIEDSDRALRLRRLIIDKDPPQFDKKLPREVGRLGTKLMRSLNIQQQRAVLRAVAARDYALLQGLPGTGKTQTISVLIQMLVGLKQRVLVTAHTHSAVDTVLCRLPDSMRVMRLGSSSRVAAGLQDKTEQALASNCSTVQQLDTLYNSMDVVGVTCLGANHAMLSRITFDVCIVDEATQVLQSTVLRPLLAANKFVLVGDPDQLPPVVRSRAARRLGMEESLFHRLMNNDATCTLQLQYRMNQPIVDVANTVAYDDRLKCADKDVAESRLRIDIEKLSQPDATPSWILKSLSPKVENAVLFLDVEPVTARDGKKCTNVDEACVVLALVDALIEGAVKPSEIGVIAPFRDQVSLLRRPLTDRGAEASTVDQFQGRDKSVIIFSCTKTGQDDDKKVKEGEILNDQRRLAVSVTRAKHKLLIIGNSRALQRYEPLQRLIIACPKLSLESNIVTSVVNKYKNCFT